MEGGWQRCSCSTAACRPAPGCSDAATAVAAAASSPAISFLFSRSVHQQAAAPGPPTSNPAGSSVHDPRPPMQEHEGHVPIQHAPACGLPSGRPRPCSRQATSRRAQQAPSHTRSRRVAGRRGHCENKTQRDSYHAGINHAKASLCGACAVQPPP